MASLVVLKFATPEGADKGLNLANELRKERLMELLDAATVTWPEGSKKPKTRHLWGQGSGAFRTTGRYSAATVRGTKWLVRDSCSGTLTRVTQGVVSVRDKVRHKSIVVRAGHRYTARPKKKK